MSPRLSPRRGEIAMTVLVALVFGTAPTVGDVGSCGRAASDLDPRAFAAGRKEMDCQRCRGCGLDTQSCRRACDPNAPSNVGWPLTCHPLDHDGEVCLRALEAASCGDYAAFVNDVDRTVPTECDFCRLGLEGGFAAPAVDP